MPNIFLHWEDFGRDNARRILTRYRDQLCTINGDMQSTGSVALACVLAAVKACGIPLSQQRIVIFGAGTAGVGIADQIHAALQRQGLSADEAYTHFWLLDKDGLLTDKSTVVLPFQKAYARSAQDIKNWKLRDANFIGLFDVINNVKPTILIGCSTLGGAFTEEMIRAMAAQVEFPIIMPLSNPTIKSEAKPDDLLNWTNGKAIIATGSPFHLVNFAGKTIRIAQSNNAFAFPGIGLGTIAVKAKLLTDEMLWAATQALAECSPVNQDKNAPLLPQLSEIRFVSRHVALAVAKEARRAGLAQIDNNIDLDQALNLTIWEPKYYPYKKTG